MSVVKQVAGAACDDSRAWDHIGQVDSFVSQPDAVRVGKTSIELDRILSAALTKVMSGQIGAAI